MKKNNKSRPPCGLTESEREAILRYHGLEWMLSPSGGGSGMLKGILYDIKYDGKRAITIPLNPRDSIPSHILSNTKNL
ncbi:hypothetical protein LJC07_06885 [Christensenellaceae bacterium OttesenSCG-928-L17]|nr:hypothetical protein [Christensenellaceae bacterium OttesenSCG-928-L17]